MLKLIHAADMHLDAPFASLPPERAAERREEQRQLLTRLAELAETERADLVLLSGDLLDSGLARYETVQALARALGEMKVPVFIAPGNHDFYAQRSIWSAGSWPENVHIFSRSTVETVEVPGLNCAVHGAAFTAPTCDQSPLKGFSTPEDGKLHLMVLHGDVDGKGRYGAIDRADIAGSGLDYLALGHVHACSGLQKEGNTWWAYPGCTEGRGFDELGDKGVLVVEAEKGNVSARFVPLCRRRYQVLTVDLSGGEDPAETLAAALPRDGENDIYRIILTGESGVEGLDLEALEAVAQPCFYSVTLRDRTRVRRDLWSRAEEDTLTGLFLRQMQARLAQADTDEDRALVEKAVRFGLAALENGEDCCP
ncbi:metallophosphoesterase [uncultured Pseudoflavonifractor sp.]|uniref:metallophosphoesterase family protein n=1 Tax=uncultured Pseudoflavonifractor sp. TaxID=1221379 RepID=UPI002600A967|nr:metallophosphoesterase [uncultured Pseudoflavonifractor sp.]